MCFLRARDVLFEPDPGLFRDRSGAKRVEKEFARAKNGLECEVGSDECIVERGFRAIFDHFFLRLTL
jgi:hypothetical protein